MTNQLAVEIEPYLLVGNSLAYTRPDLLKPVFFPLILFGSRYLKSLREENEGSTEMGIRFKVLREVRKASNILWRRSKCYTYDYIVSQEGELTILWQFKFLTACYAVRMNWRELDDAEYMEAQQNWKEGKPIEEIQVYNLAKVQSEDLKENI